MSAAAPLPCPVPVGEDLARFRASVADFVARVLVPGAARFESEQSIPASVFREAGQLGFFGLKYEARYGGSDRPYLYTQAYLEELARSGAWGTMLGLVIHSEMATPLLACFGSPEQKQRWLAPAIRGESVAAIAMTEPEGGSNLAGLRTTAQRVPGGFRLDGRKFMTGNGSRADVVCVIAALGGRRTQLPRLVALLVPRDTPGFEVVRRLDKIGLHATDNCELRFDACFVPEAQVVGRPGRAGTYLARSNAFERLALGICSTGAMELLWQHARSFAETRDIGSGTLLAHPLWRHRLAQAAIRIEASRRLIDAAVPGMDSDRPDLRLVTMAKIHATDALQHVAYMTSQALGARGFLREDLAGRSFADVRALTIGGGTTETLTEMLANLIL